MNRRIMLAAGVLFLLLFLAACGPEEADQKELIVSTVLVSTGSLQSETIISGKIEAVQSADIVAKVPGKVEKVHVDIGTMVKSGEIIVSLDADDLAASVEVASAAVDMAQVGYDIALKNYNKGQELLENGAISQTTFDNNYETVFKNSEVQLRSARAQLLRAQISYKEMFIKAPFGGVITARNINPGEMAGQAALVSIMNLDQVVIEGNIGEEKINQLQTGQPVDVMIPAASSGTFEGVIANISAAANPQTKAYPLKIKVDNPQHLLKPGMYAEVYFNDSKEAGLLVPRTAIINEKDGKMVYIVDNGIAHQRQVDTGASDQHNTIIISGLKEGEKVICTKLEEVSEGSRIRMDNDSYN